MIGDWLRQGAFRHPERPLIIAPDGRWTWSEAASAVEAGRAPLLGQSAPLAMSTNGAVILRLLTLVLSDARVVLLPSELSPDKTREWLDAIADSTSGSGEVVLFSSGTTGVPKGALHSWATLGGPVHRSPALDGSRWLLTFSLAAYAGLQVLLHVLANGGTLVMASGTPAAVAAVGAREGATHISGTPTFFRFLLSTTASEVLAALHPQQLTLGGEAADSAVLDRLRRAFPSARVTHIYASTEAGVVFSVQDGQAGFPSAWLNNPALKVPLTVRDGELWVGSSRAMRSYLGGVPSPREGDWIATGDLVEILENRVLFVGRRSERIFVGGVKVDPGHVERAILSLPEVVAVRVYGVPSSLMGQLVKAEVLLQAGVDPVVFRPHLIAYARANLRASEVPRQWAFVDHFDRTETGKLLRSKV